MQVHPHPETASRGTARQEQEGHEIADFLK